MKGHDIGKALSLVHAFWGHCELDDQYGDAMGAPMGELRPLINRGRARAFRRIRRRVKAMTGLRWAAFCREVERRTTSRWVHFESAIGRECELQREH